MKKYIFVMMAAAALFTACDPQIDNKDWSGQTVSADELTVNIVNQYDLNADGTYTKSADGNYVEFATSPSKVVEVYYINSKGAEMILSKGKPNGIFPLTPARGSEPVQTVYFRTREYDGSSVTVSTQVTVKVATDLSTEMKLFCSNSGSKKWFWCPTAVEGGAVWGNGGYQAGAQDGSENINGAWWGCGVEGGTATGSFSSQLQHSAAGKITGEEYESSFMTFGEDGIIAKFDKDGNKLGEGSWSIEKGATPGGFNATLKTTEGAILWPYAINKQGFQPTAFEIGYISKDKMILIYAPEGTGGWSECTWWSFGAKK